MVYLQKQDYDNKNIGNIEKDAEETLSTQHVAVHLCLYLD